MHKSTDKPQTKLFTVFVPTPVYKRSHLSTSTTYLSTKKINLPTGYTHFLYTFVDKFYFLSFWGNANPRFEDSFLFPSLFPSSSAVKVT